MVSRFLSRSVPALWHDNYGIFPKKTFGNGTANRSQGCRLPFVFAVAAGQYDLGNGLSLLQNTPFGIHIPLCAGQRGADRGRDNLRRLPAFFPGRENSLERPLGFRRRGIIDGRASERAVDGRDQLCLPHRRLHHHDRRPRDRPDHLGDADDRKTDPDETHRTSAGTGRNPRHHPVFGRNRRTTGC